MKNPAGILTGLLPALWMFMGTHAISQGTLAPANAPSESMKSLQEIWDRVDAQQDDPRTPISRLPYTITESGSYYVTGNLSSTTNGIVIETSGVTVDLMGFSLTGDGGYGDYGIYVDGSTNAVIDRVVIKGGSISGFRNGLYCEYMNNSRIELMLVSDNTRYGVFLYGRDGQCDGNTIADCTISGNGGLGVNLNGRYGQCDGNTIADCSISGNNSYGIYLDGSNGGQCDGNTIQGNRISKNVSRGISLWHADGNRVEANNVWGTSSGVTSFGIRTTSATGNFILKNTCVGNGTNYDLGSDDTAGPIVSASGFLSATGDAAHPWANFSR